TPQTFQQLHCDFKNEPYLLEKLHRRLAAESRLSRRWATSVISSHPELNPIEYFGGWCKNYFHEQSNGKFEHRKRILQEALDMCPL
ncbi:hypothetical protein B0H10DRAFT_2115205, partial [Mycena sp. CBHHK59/15]